MKPRLKNKDFYYLRVKIISLFNPLVGWILIFNYFNFGVSLSSGINRNNFNGLNQFRYNPQPTQYQWHFDKSQVSLNSQQHQLSHEQQQSFKTYPQVMHANHRYPDKKKEDKFSSGSGNLWLSKLFTRIINLSKNRVFEQEEELGGGSGGGDGNNKERKKVTRLPGLPANPPIPHFNITNVINLINMAGNDAEIDDESEALLVQTLTEVVNFIGLQDLNDFLGMFFMFFILGPIMIPLYWMPIALVAFGFLMIPLIYNMPLAAATIGKSYKSGGRNGSRSGSGSGGLFESQCMEMISCEVNNLVRSSPWSDWIAKTFNLTKVEWASEEPPPNKKGGRKNKYLKQEECSKYPCILVSPMRSFFGSWYDYFFNYQKILDQKKEIVDKINANRNLLN